MPIRIAIYYSKSNHVAMGLHGVRKVHIIVFEQKRSAKDKFQKIHYRADLQIVINGQSLQVHRQHFLVTQFL